MLSSSLDHAPLFIFGSKWFVHLSLHCFPTRPGSLFVFGPLEVPPAGSPLASAAQHLPLVSTSLLSSSLLLPTFCDPRAAAPSSTSPGRFDFPCEARPVCQHHYWLPPADADSQCRVGTTWVGEKMSFAPLVPRSHAVATKARSGREKHI